MADFISFNEARLMQPTYSVEALQDATIGSGIRYKGDKFSALEISDHLFHVLLNSPGQESASMKLVPGMPGTEDYVEPALQVVGYTEDGSVVTYDDMRQQALQAEENDGSQETEVEPSVQLRTEVERAALEQPVDQAASSGGPRTLPVTAVERDPAEVQVDNQEAQGGSNFTAAAVRQKRTKSE